MENELEFYRKKYEADISIAALTPTVCALMGLPLPKQCEAAAIPAVADQAFRLAGGEGKIEKVLVFAPDAVGEVQRQRFPEKLQRVQDLAGFRFKAGSVMPSVTPVCFGSIFSGASPAVHGIREYAKPVLQIETLFDSLAAAGKNAAIVSVNECSIDKIFRGRKVDYYSLRTDEAVFQLTRKLLAEDQYDFILSYMTEYDSSSHHTGPWSEESVAELEQGVQYFETLVGDIERIWKGRHYAAIWAPDHGNHPIDAKTGGHGQDIADDMVVNHYYRIR